MKRMLKILLLWLLALALPMQGIAVVSYTCNMQHGHAHSGVAEHQHGTAHAEHQHLHSAAQSESDSSAHSDQHLKPSQCSTCAACCVATAIPPSLMDLTASDTPSIAVLPSPDSVFTGHIPDPLKRPPRSASI